MKIGKSDMQQTLDGKMQAHHASFDTFIRAWIQEYTHAGGRIHCGRGCSGCCSLVVNATFPEARFLADSLSGQQGERVVAHVARLRHLLPKCTDLKSFLGLHRREIGSCPLLDDAGSCGAYDRRPYSCRALLATLDSRWCGIDFSGLSPAEKEAFIASLDRSVVAFPMHYAAAPQELGQELEERRSHEMRERFGFSLYGNLPVLLHLERDHDLSGAVAKGAEATAQLLARTGLDHPFLVVLDAGSGR